MYKDNGSEKVLKKIQVLVSAFQLENCDYVETAKNFIYDVNGYYPLVRISKYKGLIEYFEIEELN